MKKLITILTCAFCLSGIMAQNADGPGRAVPQKTSELKALYSQERALKTAGDVAGLETNRQAIIAAWQAIDPTIAAEFKLNQTTAIETFAPKTIQKRPNVPYNNNPLWGNDLLLNNGHFDGVDMDTALDGTIYVAAYENRVRYGLGNDLVSLFKSVDNGISFSSIPGVDVDIADLTKIKLTIMDKGADKGLFITYSTAGGSLINSRLDIAGGPDGYILEVIAVGVKEFDIDVDYEFVNTAQLYAVYTKENNFLYSARTLANGLGLFWGDEHSLGFLARECAISYGKGNTYTSFIGFNSGNLYFASNTSFNDPAGWDPIIQLTDGTVRESQDISLSAERKEYIEYSVLALASQRTAGSDDPLIGTVNIVQEGVATPEDIENKPSDVLGWDSWCRKEDGNNIIKTSFITRGEFSCNVKNYNGPVWDASEVISDNFMTAYQNFSAVAEDMNNNAIAVYIGANLSGLYFDSSNLLEVGENALSSFVFYPNPASSTLNIKAASSITNVAIYNILGQKVLNQKLDALSSEIDVSGLSSGTYVMKVTIGSEIGSYKIIKN